MGNSADMTTGMPEGREQTTRVALRLDDAVNVVCPWTGAPASAEGLTLYSGAVVGFANAGLRDQFAQAVRHFEDALAVRRAETAGNSE